MTAYLIIFHLILGIDYIAALIGPVLSDIVRLESLFRIVQ